MGDDKSGATNGVNKPNIAAEDVEMA
jgi:hypothetical protein